MLNLQQVKNQYPQCRSIDFEKCTSFLNSSGLDKKQITSQTYPVAKLEGPHPFSQNSTATLIEIAKALTRNSQNVIGIVEKL